MQLNLFEKKSRAPPPKPEPQRQPYRVHLERHAVPDPCGKPDKRGKYGYEKLHDELAKLPSLYRDQFNCLTVAMPEVIGKQFLKCFKMFMSFDNADLMDFDESRGRL